MRTYLEQVAGKVGEQLTVSGWVDSVRDHGQLLFIDLRDKTGVLQLVVPAESGEVFNQAKALGREYVISATGKLRDRAADLVNPKLDNGRIELVIETLEVHSTSKPLPFPIDTDGREIDENVRLKYRYLDLRRPRLQKIMKDKAKFMLAVRNWMEQDGFTEIITPLLTSTSPEGARDFVIPSRLHPGKFFVLPQAPQQFKQLLMVAGLDKYYQIAPCARDEDPRADRHAGVFYQIDIEMSFPTIDRLFDTAERMLADTYKSVAPQKQIVQTPFPRLKFVEAQERYGSDKPDIRFDMELQEITELVKGKTEFNVFNNAEVVKAIVAVGAGEWSRAQLEELETFAKQQGAGGLAYVKVAESGGQPTLETGIAKFLEPVGASLIQFLKAKPGDLILFGADTRPKVNKVLGQVRSLLGEKLGLKDPHKLAFVWITDFPFFEVDEKSGKLDFGHNPFSMPKGGLSAFDAEDPLTIESLQYDLALNGYEAMSGSIRNHNPEVLIKAFEKVGYDRQTVERRFGALYEAFQYGVPPHGGWAIGFDRLFMILIDEPNIRDTYAFPLSSSGVDLLMNAPSELDPADLKVLKIRVDLPQSKS
jgi:aspartyl-tRNA synthetase